MSDQQQTPPETPQEPQERTVPYDRFREVNMQAREFKNALEAMQQRVQEMEDEKKSETERHRSRADRLEQQVAEVMAKNMKLERGRWVSSAAREANFIDPDDAVALVDLSGIESESDAQKAVRDVAKRKEHLIRKEEQKPQIGQVLQNGQPVQPGQPAPRPEDEALLQQIKGTLDQGWTSTNAFGN